MDVNNVVDVLRELIKINRDGEKGYQDAAQHAKATADGAKCVATCHIFRG